MQEHPLDLAKRWLQQAQDDCVVAEELREEERHNVACFLAQQSAEKALKALLVWRGGDYPRLHAIGTLIEELRRIDAPLAERLREATALDAYYLSTRYPDALDGGLPSASFFDKEAKLAIERARDVLSVVAEELTKAEEPNRSGGE
jgi:HEPN domain-containing protein